MGEEQKATRLRINTDLRQQAEALKAAGTSAFRKGDVAAALKAWSEARNLASDAEDTQLWEAASANVVLAELKLEHWVAAENVATELLSRSPMHEKALYRRGLAREA